MTEALHGNPKLELWYKNIQGGPAKLTLHGNPKRTNLGIRAMQGRPLIAGMRLCSYLRYPTLVVPRAAYQSETLGAVTTEAVHCRRLCRNWLAVPGDIAIAKICGEAVD